MEYVLTADQSTGIDNYKLVHERRFQRIIDFQKIIHLSTPDVIFTEFVRLSRLVSGAKHNLETDEYEHPYDYDTMIIIEDSQFGERILTSFEPGLALTELRIIIPCRRCGADDGVTCRLIDHLMGVDGCKECVIHRLSLSTNVFINKAEIVNINYNRCYDYSMTHYTHSKSRILIICPEHGEFPQEADVHTRGGGCQVCAYIEKGLRHRLTTDEFILAASLKHNDKYDYSKVVYVHSDIKVIITCPIHGDFPQTPGGHLSGRGCNECRKDLVSVQHTLSQEEFIANAKLHHGDRYDYSKVDYIHNKLKVCIICPEHGEFPQEANAHSRGSGCPICGINKLINSRRHTIEDFIRISREKHGDKYNYDKVSYHNADTDVCIICPEHGEFLQSPDVHMGGCGCQRCAKHGFDSTINAILYYLKIDINNEYLYKLGITNKTVVDRYSSSDKCLFPYEIISEISFDIGRDALDEETRLKRKYSDYLYKGEPVFTRSRCQEIFTHDILAMEYNTISS